MIDLYIVPLPVIFVCGLALIWGVSELGWRLGARRTDHSTNINTLESATIGLLALLIGFTFAMALTRFEARRDAVVRRRTRSARPRCARVSSPNRNGARV